MRYPEATPIPKGKGGSDTDLTEVYPSAEPRPLERARDGFRLAKALVNLPPHGRRNNISMRQGKPRGPVPEGKAASMFEKTMITESADHM